VTAIFPYTFADSGVSCVTLPSTLTDIYEGAFSNAKNLTAITLPASLTGIGSSVFRSASNLATVNFQGNAPSVGGNAFDGVASGAKAKVATRSLTGYGADGADFNGLTVVLPPLPPAPFVAVTFPSVPTWYMKGHSGHFQIKVPVSTGGDTRGAAQPLTLQLSNVANPSPRLPLVASYAGKVVKYSASFTWNHNWRFKPLWVRVGTKGGKWTAWTKVERRDTP
jgi:hypothetical protein